MTKIGFFALLLVAAASPARADCAADAKETRARVEQFSHAPPRDDIAIVVIRAIASDVPG